MVKGHLTIRLREGSMELEKIELDEGEFTIVPKGVVHLPVADEEAHIMIFEPNTTVNTGILNRIERLRDWREYENIPGRCFYG